MTAAPAARIAALDLVRGIAVLGILAVNIAGFAGPPAATLTPHLPHPASAADEWAFALMLVGFEGKMRALFSILFGASMLLFIERTEHAGRDGARLQLRRLGWLALLGYALYLLLWWGDILFTYALVGMVALWLHRLEPFKLVTAAVLAFTLWHGGIAVASWGGVARERAVLDGTATAAEADRYADGAARFLREMDKSLAEHRSGFAAQITAKALGDPAMPLRMAIATFCETLPLMLIGMALYRTGFFAGEWPRARLRALAIGGIAAGLVPTLAMLGWAWPRHFPAVAMNAWMLSWGAMPHAAMALGYAALAMLAAPRLIASRIGGRIIAAGRMAFSNYIGTSLVMTATFYGWGLGLVGTVGHAAQMWFVALGWVLMLAWSAPWLARFRQGPLEWLWRSLTERRILPMRR